MMPASSGSKRAQVSKDKTMALVFIGIAAVVLVGGIFVSKSFWDEANYLSKIAGQKEAARDQLEDNKAAIESVRQSYDTFVKENPNLIAGNRDDKGANGGDNAKLILDALPSTYDFPALISSVEGLLEPYSITSINGVDDTAGQTDVPINSPIVEIPLTLQFKSTYDGHREAIDSLRRSIRPFKIVRLEMSGTNAEINNKIDVITYYQPETGLKIDQERVE